MAAFFTNIMRAISGSSNPKDWRLGKAPVPPEFSKGKAVPRGTALIGGDEGPPPGLALAGAQSAARAAAARQRTKGKEQNALTKLRPTGQQTVPARLVRRTILGGTTPRLY